jgi:3-oxoacyl-(acyl-carrier-protein) synthase
MERVYITGIGAISALGKNVSENLKALRKGEGGIRKAKHFKSNFADELFFAEIDQSDEQLRNSLNINSRPDFTRTSLIAFAAFEEAIKDARLSQGIISDLSTAIISSSSVGGMCYTDELYHDANLTGTPSPFIRSYEGSDHTLRIVERYKIGGISDTINTACSSSANAIMLGVRLIKSGRAKRVIVGGADCLAKFTVNGFNSLTIVSREPCRPFDKFRDGLTLGEAAAYLVLEGEESVQGKRRYAEVKGCGNANDAHHPSATSDEAFGPIGAMRRALENADLEPEQIDYINAHGTGTPNNDLTESFAFSQVFKKVPPYNSTKSYTGHTLAAAGALEAVYSVLSIQNGELYPSLNCSKPLEEYSFSPIEAFQSGINIQNVLSNSFGFGGNCTSVILSKCS